jgi:hypothetical protein
MANLALFNTAGSPNADPATNKAIVNPIPARLLAPMS